MHHVAWLRDATLAGPVIYEVRSWGRLLVRWQVNPDGTGEIWRQGQGQDTGVWKYRLRMEDSAFRTFATNVEDARRATHADVVANTLGMLVGALLALVVGRVLRARASEGRADLPDRHSPAEELDPPR